MRSINRRWRVGAGVGLFAMLFLAACSGGSSPSSSSSSPIIIGGQFVLSGARAESGQAQVLGANLALSIINANGGVLGRHVNIDVQDDAGDPGDAVPAADTLIQSDSVVGMIGPTAQTASVVLPLVDRANIPMFELGGGANFDFEKDSHFFRMSPSDTEQSYAMVVYAHSKGWNSIGIATGNGATDESLIPGILAAAKVLGMTVTAQVTFAEGATSFRSEISQLYANHPQAILGQFTIPSAGVVFGELAQENLTATPWVASNLWFDPSFVTAVGKTVASGPIYMANPTAGGAGLAPFLAALKKETGQTQALGPATYTWDAINTWALGVEEAGTTSSPAVEKGILKAANGPGTVCYDFVTCSNLLKQGKSINYNGAASSVDFDQYHNVFGPFDILQYLPSGSTQALETLTPEQIQADLKGL